MSFDIIGTGKCVPEKILTNDELSGMMDTSDEWILTRTGIRARFISRGESLLDLGAGAARQALKNAGVEASSLDLIVVSTVRGDMRTPSLACLIQGEIGADCPAFDVNAACTGFLYALDVAAAYLDSGRAEHVLVVAAEAMSKQVDWNNRATCVLFGDGAGAVVLRKGGGLLSMKLTSKGDDSLLRIPNGEGNSPFNLREAEPEYLYMAGSEVFQFAVNAMCGGVREVLKEAHLTAEEIRMLIPHQANLRILNFAKDRLKLREEQVAVGIDRYGNTSSASIPLLLADLTEAGTLKKGDVIAMAAFGGGLTSGACVIRL